jgi:hypothetical protein
MKNLFIVDSGNLGLIIYMRYFIFLLLSAVMLVLTLFITLATSL